MGGGESFADDLNGERGTVSSRVALLLRSAEVKPLFYRFVQQQLNSSLFLYHRRTSGQVQLDLVLWFGDATRKGSEGECVLSIY